MEDLWLFSFNGGGYDYIPLSTNSYVGDLESCLKDFVSRNPHPEFCIVTGDPLLITALNTSMNNIQIKVFKYPSLEQIP